MTVRITKIEIEENDYGFQVTLTDQYGDTDTRVFDDREQAEEAANHVAKIHGAPITRGLG